MCDIYLRCIIWVGKLNVPMYVLLAVIRAETPSYLSSLATPPLTFVERVAYIIPVSYITLTWWSNALFVTALLVSYVFGTLGAIESLRFCSKFRISHADEDEGP